MKLPDINDGLVVGILGAGAMGRGIAQIAALGGFPVILCDLDKDAEKSAKIFIDKMINRLVEKGKIKKQIAQKAIENIKLAGGKLSEFAKADLVIEAIVENIEIKKSVFAELESITGDNCILATNTSSLSVSEIANAVKNSGRVAGFHFFNPVPLMKIAEVIPGVLTDPSVSDFLLKLGKKFGHKTVLAKDYPGFIVNHAGRGYSTEALQILGETVTDIETIDALLRKAGGFRMGPFELLDLTALDVSHPVMESIYTQFYQEPRYRPSVITRQRLSAGLLGRKTGRGFYDYPPKPEADKKPQPTSHKKYKVWFGELYGEQRKPVLSILSDVNY